MNATKITGTLPRHDDQGREWTAEMIMEYAVMITHGGAWPMPTPPCHVCEEGITANDLQTLAGHLRWHR